MHPFSMPTNEVFYMLHPTINIFPRISVTWLVLSNLGHLFVTVVDGPVAKSSAFAMGKPGIKGISICFCRSSPIVDPSPIVDLKNSY